MKLTVCIPVYNFDVRDLVKDLDKQIKAHELDAEIVLIDDGSAAEFIAINKAVEMLSENFIFLEKNVGRSQIRNLFLYYANGDFLLFLDCDGKVLSKNFLKIYFEYLHKNPATKVIYGGRQVSQVAPERNKCLRWKFAVERENLPVEKRTEIPYLSFQTNNFVLKKSVLKKINFNPEFQKYGYEDLLFAMDLQEAKIPIHHIDNPVFNNDLETNEVYVNKVEESIESLSKMMKSRKTSAKISEVKLVKAYTLFSKSNADVWFQKLFKIRKQKTREKLIRGNVSLRYLDFYKMGLLFEKMANK